MAGCASANGARRTGRRSEGDGGAIYRFWYRQWDCSRGRRRPSISPKCHRREVRHEAERQQALRRCQHKRLLLRCIQTTRGLKYFQSRPATARPPNATAAYLKCGDRAQYEQHAEYSKCQACTRPLPAKPQITDENCGMIVRPLPSRKQRFCNPIDCCRQQPKHNATHCKDDESKQPFAQRRGHTAINGRAKRSAAPIRK